MGIRERIFVIICIAATVLTGCSGGKHEARFFVNGAVVTMEGNFPSGVEALLIDAKGTGIAMSCDAGVLKSPPVLPGKYTLRLKETVNDVLLVGESEPFDLIDCDLSILPLIMPDADDLKALGEPQNSALAVVVRDENGRYIPTNVVMAGQVQPLVSAIPALVNNIPAGKMDVTIIAGGQQETRTDVYFTSGAVTVLNFNVGQLSASYRVEGMVVDTDGRPGAGMTAALYHNSTKVSQTDTHSDGSYYYTGIEPGIYYVKITKTVDGVLKAKNSETFSVISGDVEVENVVVPALEWGTIPSYVIVAMGDSVTSGTRVNNNETYSAVLQSLLHDAGFCDTVLQRGIPGETTEGALARLDDIIALHPDFVTIMYGINDAYCPWENETTEVSLNEYGRNLQNMIRDLKSAGICPVLLTPTPMSPYGSDTITFANRPPYSTYGDINFMLKQFVEKAKQIGDQNNTPTLDIYGALIQLGVQNDADGSYLIEGIHPTPHLHRVIAGIIADYFEGIER